jgi:hypothetical protein
VVGKLLNSVRDGGFTSCQEESSLSRVEAHGRNRTAQYILLEGQYGDQSAGFALEPSAWSVMATAIEAAEESLKTQ